MSVRFDPEIEPMAYPEGSDVVATGRELISFEPDGSTFPVFSISDDCVCRDHIENVEQAMVKALLEAENGVNRVHTAVFRVFVVRLCSKTGKKEVFCGSAVYVAGVLVTAQHVVAEEATLEHRPGEVFTRLGVFVSNAEYSAGTFGYLSGRSEVRCGHKPALTSGLCRSGVHLAVSAVEGDQAAALRSGCSGRPAGRRRAAQWRWR